MTVTVKWSRLGRAMLDEWMTWVRQSPGGSDQRAEFERTELVAQLVRYRGVPPGAGSIPCSEPDSVEYVWRYSNVSVQYRVTNRRRVFQGARLEIVILRVGIRLG